MARIFLGIKESDYFDSDGRAAQARGGQCGTDIPEEPGVRGKRIDAESGTANRQVRAGKNVRPHHVARHGTRFGDRWRMDFGLRLHLTL